MPVGMVIQMFLPLTVSFLLWVSIISVKFSTKILRSEFDLPFLSTKSVVTKHSFKEGGIRFSDLAGAYLDMARHELFFTTDQT